ncbi:MAG TPA: OpgC domain-containing protein [Daejeonella sp.]|nr:OpgC domain-containing protein [Daejeonella sp.]
MKRNLHIDNIRGLLLVIILIDHLELRLSAITNSPLGYTSAAEGFIFMSGLVAGIVYMGRALKTDFKQMSLHAQKRSFTIYQYHIFLYALTLIIFLNSDTINQFWKADMPLMAANPLLAFFQGISLLYQPAPNDILPIYCILLLLLPVVLKQFVKNKLTLVLAISLALYLLGQFQLVETTISGLNKTMSTSIDLGYFNILSWQLLFFLGLLLGTWEVKNYPWWTAFKKNRVIFFVSLSVIIPCLVLRHTLYKNIPYADILINRSHLAPLRLLNFLSISFVVNYLISRYRPSVSAFLVYLGQNSLQVFSFHVIVVLCMAPFVPLIVKTGYLTELVITALAILSLWIPAFLNVLYTKRNQRKKNLQLVSDDLKLAK